ncbi:MAG: DUF4261 domain-containing protein [Oscillospiraceae bacterium]
MEIKDINNNERESKVLAAFVLFKDANMDWPRFRHYLKEDWNIVPQDDVKDNALVFRADGMTAACSLLPCKVPDNEAEESVKNNFLWKNGEAEVAKHGANVMVAIMEKTDELEQAKLLVKIVSSMLRLKNTIGVYKNPTVYEKDFYLKFSQPLKNGDLPMPVLIHVGMYITKESLICAYTSGMESFGKREIEIVDSKAKPDELYRLIISIAELLLATGVELNDGDTIDLSDSEILPVSISDGVSVQGKTMKIGYKQ